MTTDNQNSDAEIPWARLHALTAAASADAPSWPPIFGGSAPYCHVEETRLGLAKLYSRAREAVMIAWTAIHKMRGPADASPSDDVRWAVVSPDGMVLRGYSTGRGARWSATHRGDGVAMRVACPEARRRRCEDHHERLRRACRFALAVGELFGAVTVALGGVPMRSAICGVTDDRFNVTGLFWYLGFGREERHPPADAVLAFASGGSIKDLREALVVDLPQTAR